jgi:hypothetical protein
MGLMLAEIGTLSFIRSSAMSLSKLRKVKSWTMARNTKRDSGLLLLSHLSCSPKLTLIMNHMKLEQIKRFNTENFKFL